MKRQRKTRIFTYFAVMFIVAFLLLLLSYCMEQNSALLDRPASVAAATYEKQE